MITIEKHNKPISILNHLCNLRNLWLPVSYRLRLPKIWT